MNRSAQTHFSQMDPYCKVEKQFPYHKQWGRMVFLEKTKIILEYTLMLICLVVTRLSSIDFIDSKITTSNIVFQQQHLSLTP